MINTIFWDFDGVLMDSNLVRDKGFAEVLNGFPENQIEQLLAFHQANGGLSRYVKFRYFFEKIRGERISDEGVQEWADKFSIIMKKLLINPELIIHETLGFVKMNYQKYQMHIVSGSDEKELRFLCRELGISSYFKSIHGSPTPKIQLVADVVKQHQYNCENCILIGDSVNDYEAANANQIYFLAYNNSKISDLSTIEFKID